MLGLEEPRYRRSIAVLENKDRLYPGKARG
jgi:hypothetical protein